MMPPKPWIQERAVFFIVFVAFVIWISALLTVGRHVPEDSARSLIEGSASKSKYNSETYDDEPVKGWENVTDLIMVAGHTIFIGSDYGESPVNESHWSKTSCGCVVLHTLHVAVRRYLQGGQQQQLDSFIQHIKVNLRP